VVLVVVNKKTGAAIPIAWAPCIKEKDDKVNGKMAWELVLDLLDLVVASDGLVFRAGQSCILTQNKTNPSSARRATQL